MNTKRHLCDKCANTYPDCYSTGAPVVKFGNGVGNDNIFECDTFNKKRKIKRIMYKMLIPKEEAILLEEVSIRENISKGDIFRRSLALFSHVRKANSKGEKLILRDTEGNETEVVFDEK